MDIVREHRVRVPLRVPLAGSSTREVLLVEGPVGWGEVSPLPGYPTDLRLARAAAEEAACLGWPPPVRDMVPVAALVPAVEPFQAAQLAGHAATTGVTTFKVKVGSGDDEGRLAAVRDAVGPRAAVRIDANGAWSLDEAEAALRRLAHFEIELAEQPVAALSDLARLRRRSPVPLAADECVRSVEDARRVAALEAADAVVLKVQALGGVRAALAVAEAAEVPVIVSSMIETSVGLAAGVALAACLPELPFANGLGTGLLLAGDVVAEPLVPRCGVLPVRPVAPAPDPELLDRYAAGP